MTEKNFCITLVKLSCVALWEIRGISEGLGFLPTSEICPASHRVPGLCHLRDGKLRLFPRGHPARGGRALCGFRLPGAGGGRGAFSGQPLLSSRQFVPTEAILLSRYTGFWAFHKINRILIRLFWNFSQIISDSFTIREQLSYLKAALLLKYTLSFYRNSNRLICWGLFRSSSRYF